MEKELASFRKRYVWQVWVTFLVVLFYLTATMVGLGLAIAESQTVPLLGLVGSTLMCIMYTLRKHANLLVLKDNELLRQAYMEEHDERNIAIRAKAGQPVVQWCSVGMLIGGCLLFVLADLRVVAREMKFVFIGAGAALYLAALIQLLISWALKKYWEKRM